MERNAISYLNNWKKSNNRKPLLIQGARQVGKTSLVRLWAGAEFENLLEFNLELHNHAQLFTELKEAKQILPEIELLLQKKNSAWEDIAFYRRDSSRGKGAHAIEIFF